METHSRSLHGQRMSTATEPTGEHPGSRMGQRNQKQAASNEPFHNSTTTPNTRFTTAVWGRAAPVCAFRLRGGANGGMMAFSLRVCGPANKWVVFQDAAMILFIQLVWRARLLFDLRICCLRFNHGIDTHCFATPCPHNGSIFRPWDWPAQCIDF